MRLVGLSLIGLTACAQVFGLEQPVNAIGDAPQPPHGDGDGNSGSRCQGDDFNDNMLDTNRWMSFIEGNSQLTEQNQQLQIVLDDGNGSRYSGLDAVQPLSATETGVQVEVVQPSGDGPTEAALVLFLNGANQMFMGKDGMVLQATVKTGGANDRMMMPWSDNYRFLRIERTTAAEAVFSTSPNGTTWTVFRKASAAFAAQGVKAQIYAGHYQQAAASTVVFDNFKLLSAGCD